MCTRVHENARERPVVWTRFGHSRARAPSAGSCGAAGDRVPTRRLVRRRDALRDSTLTDAKGFAGRGSEGAALIALEAIGAGRLAQQFRRPCGLSSAHSLVSIAGWLDDVAHESAVGAGTHKGAVNVFGNSVVPINCALNELDLKNVIAFAVANGPDRT